MTRGFICRSGPWGFIEVDGLTDRKLLSRAFWVLGGGEAMDDTIWRGKNAVDCLVFLGGVGNQTLHSTVYGRNSERWDRQPARRRRENEGANGFVHLSSPPQLFTAEEVVLPRRPFDLKGWSGGF